MMLLVLLLNFFCASFMTGLIWIVQLVHYPLFANVGRQEFGNYHHLHQVNISYIVVPVMLVEIISSAALVMFWSGELDLERLILWSALALNILLWLVTAFYSLPSHSRLTQGFEDLHLKKLLSTNWLRTAAWSFRSLLLGYIISRYLSFQLT